MMKLKKLLFKWLFCLIPAVIATAMYFILPYFPRFTEYIIARGLFRVIAFPYEWLMSVIPFSVTEIVVVLAIPAIVALIVVWIVKLIKKPNSKQTAERGIRFVAWCLSIAWLLYILTSDLAEKATKAREELPEDEKGCAALSVKRSEFLKLTDDCYKNLRKEYPFLKTSTWRVKSVMLSHWWSYTGTTGVYCPWLGEANVNTDIPIAELGHTAAHEVAHTMGFAKENECNFLGWIACSVSDLPDYEYSGHLQAYIYCSNALYKADKELWEMAYQKLSHSVLRDLKNQSEYWDSFEGEVMESSQEFNDAFIKANGVESGVLSYNQMVELMLRYYDKQNLLN